MARPQIIIDMGILERLAAYPLTMYEIAEIMKVSYKTIERRVKSEFKCSFVEFQDKKRANLKINILNKQLEVAMGNDKEKRPPSVAMLIWLGKNYLGQKDQIDHVVETKQHVIYDTVWSDSPQDIEVVSAPPGAITGS